MILTEKNILKFIVFAPLITVPFIAFLIAYFILTRNHDNFQTTIKSLQKDLIVVEKKKVQAKVESVIDLVKYRQSIIKEELKNRVKDRVYTAYNVAHSIHQQFKGKKSDEEIKKLIVSALRPLIWNNAESFIWILDFQGVSYLAPEYLRHLEGRSWIDIQGASGEYVIQEEIAFCQAHQEGFFWNTFTKPNDPTMQQHEQLVYLKAFDDYNWYMGSGEYLQTAAQISDKELLNSIQKIGEHGSSYIFVLDSDLSILLNTSINKTPHANTQNVLKKIETLLAKQESGFIEYEWINPVTQKQEQKYSYIQRVQKDGWIIGSGFYASEIQTVAKIQIKTLEGEYNKETRYLLVLSAFFILISFVVSYILHIYIKKILQRYEIDILAKQKALRKLNQSLEAKVQSRTKELEESTKQLQELAHKDSLTSIENRYSIMKTLESEIDRAKRYKTKLSVVMYDIDHFKDINDTYGHDVGDDILIALTQLVNQNCREIDFLGRYGGEEFLIIMPNTSREEAKEFAHRIRLVVQNHSFKIIGKLTISLGLIEYREGEEIKELFKRLDILLYKAKNGGRNRLCSDDETEDIF
ncbi:MAG: cache domain-containing protein [Helicobacteraceae bacterium]|nr:cache domain-containing protein [Helicobacteraceae bacterium]